MLPERPQVEAVLLPEDPALLWTYAEPSPASPHVRLDQLAWNSSVMPLGALIRLAVEMPKKPTTTSPGSVVVTEGAQGSFVFGVNAPLCESIGVVRSTFLKSRIAPVADDAEPSDQPYAAGSDEPATR